MAIRTPDQRLRVFVSSTLAELADERAAVARAISALRLTPVMFELGARPYPPQELYRAYLAQSDIFVGLYWQRYGWVGPGMDMSGLEDEFQLSGAMPRLLYVKTPAPEREPRLTDLIQQVQADASDSYRSFRSPRELGRLVRDDLAVLLSERFVASADPAGPGLLTERPAALPPAEPEPAVPAPRRTLPVALTSLFGRDQDIEQVLQLLDGHRLVTLTGPGGIGKTRLAAAVGEHVEGSVVFVPLASLNDPALVLPQVAAELGIPMEGARPPLGVLAEQLGDSPTLLVLDNLEQVVAVGPQLDELLARCPGLRILATSRTVLRLRAEREYPVPELASEEAIALFVDRAQAVRPDFDLTEGNAGAVAEICRLLDGLPLAIELAAARIRLLDPDALLARLRTSFDALGAGPVDLPERQRTLRAAIEWSIGLLTADEREMLGTLSVFVDGWTLDAALALDDRALDLLDALAGHSLVSVHGARFRMLSSVREIAAELRTDPDVERRHAHYFRDVTACADWATVGSTQSAELLRPEEGNLRAAVRWFMAHDIGPLPRMFRTFWMFWYRYDHVVEGRVWIEELLPRVDELDDRARTELALMATVTAVEVGDDDGALGGIAQLDLEVDDPHLASLAQLARAWALPIVGDYDGALTAVQLALDGLRPLGDVFMSEGALNTLAMLEIARGHDDSAARALTEAVDLADRHGRTWNTPITIVLLAGLAVRRGEQDEARVLLRRAVGPDTDLSTQATTLGLVVLAEAALLDGDPPEAARALGAADGIRRRTGIRVWTTERSSDEELVARVRETLDPQLFTKAFAEGAALTRRDAVALLRD